LDFSGYSDMAIGAARCFGIVLPLNFHSPYKATNISEFWRRWHVTLTRWLRLYLFVPISRSLMRRGEAWDAPAVFVAQLTTMLLCGLWHGAGWSFVVWGGVHGLLLLGHDAWEAIKARSELSGALPAPVGAWLGRCGLMAVLAATFVLFRAESLPVAGHVLAGMAFGHGLALGPESATLVAWIEPWLPGAVRVSELTGLHAGGAAFLHLGALFGIVWWLPNTQQLLSAHRPVLDLQRFGPVKAQWIQWRPNLGWAVIAVIASGWALYHITVSGYEDFVYRFF
jgi:hypothetical protein